MLSKRVLIVSPHRDDEVLGCGGFIMRRAHNSLSLPYSIVGATHVRYYNTVHPSVPQEQYDNEANTVAKVGGFTSSVSALTGVNRLDQVPVADYICDLENFIAEYKPKILLAPYPSYNQDHRHLFEAVRTAVRAHDKNWFVPHVWLYEQPETVHTLNNGFVPNVLVPINIEDKLKLYSKYESQIRGHRTLDHVRALAVLRGSQCNTQAAEAFMAIRSVYDDV